MATYRLNMLAPSNSMCLTTVVASPDSSGYCQSPAETIGNAATYSYITAPAMTAWQSCVGLALTNSQPISQRCVTAISNGVTERARSASRPSPQLRCSA